MARKIFTPYNKEVFQLETERSEAKRTAFRYAYGSQYTAEQTVFVDES